MPGINELRHTLATIIIRYAVARIKSDTPPVEKDIITSLSSQSFAQQVATLKKLIDDATINDKTRQPVLVYLLYSIEILEPFSDRVAPLNENKASTIQKHLVELFINLQTLLKTPQSTVISCYCGKLEIKAYGFVSGYWPISYPSVSATLITDLLFPLLRLAIDAKSNDIMQAITDLIETTQTKLLIKSLQEDNKALKKELEIAISEIKSAKEQLAHHLAAEGTKLFQSVSKEATAPLVQAYPGIFGATGVYSMYRTKLNKTSNESDTGKTLEQKDSSSNDKTGPSD